MAIIIMVLWMNIQKYSRATGRWLEGIHRKFFFIIMSFLIFWFFHEQKEFVPLITVTGLAITATTQLTITWATAPKTDALSTRTITWTVASTIT